MVDGVLVKEEIVAVQVDGDIEHAFGAADAADVIDVRVREQNGANLQALTVDERQRSSTSSPGSIRTASSGLHPTT